MASHARNQLFEALAEVALAYALDPSGKDTIKAVLSQILRDARESPAGEGVRRPGRRRVRRV